MFEEVLVRGMFVKNNSQRIQLFFKALINKE